MFVVKGTASTDIYTNCPTLSLHGALPVPPALPPMPGIDRALYETVTTSEALDRWIEAARAAHVVAVDTETASLDSVTGGGEHPGTSARTCAGGGAVDRKSTRLNSSN